MEEPCAGKNKKYTRRYLEENPPCKTQSQRGLRPDRRRGEVLEIYHDRRREPRKCETCHSFHRRHDSSERKSRRRGRFRRVCETVHEGGLEKIKDYVRGLEKDDPECWKYPRYKQYDDIAAISISF